jgi:hypothetical protein
VVRVYKVTAQFDAAGNCVYKNLRPSGYENWAKQSELQIAQGKSLQMEWSANAKQKQIADFILFPMFGLASTLRTVQRFASYAPKAKVVACDVLGETEKYAWIDPYNFKETERELDHLFMNFSRHKALLATHVFKEQWESHSLTGAVFEEVQEMSDDRFINPSLH